MRLERDPAWWAEVASHPAVAPVVGDVQALADAVSSEWTQPFASKNGGYLMMQRDRFGLTWEVHALFRPEGWGREAAYASKVVFSRVFSAGAQLVYCCEIAGRFSPPLSHGWRPQGAFRWCDEAAANVRSWMLSVGAWEASPARSRMCRSSPQSLP